MKRWTLAAAAALAVPLLVGCELEDVMYDGDVPGAPRSFDAYYYGRAVELTWDLPVQWNGEFFRVYSKRTSDVDYAMIAEITNCAAGHCSFRDVNVTPGVTYLYYVASVSRGGAETTSASSVQVPVPQPTPPPVPGQIQVIALDHANYVRWGANARTASDFAKYRVWLYSQSQSFLLGETDSEGFLDLLAENGKSYTYFVTSLDDLGHESQGSASAVGTPRPDFTSEWLYDYFTTPASSGFRFQQSDASNPVMSGTASNRHFRLEVDTQGWWLVPGPNTAIYPTGYATTALKCGPAADSGCKSVEQAPTSGYVTTDVSLAAQNTYVLRVRGDDGQTRYGAIRVQLLGYDGSNKPIIIFDWAYQLQPNSPSLAPEWMGR
jgi:hypothetical protein